MNNSCIISIDIGTKNLGYSIIKYGDSLKTLDITFDIFIIDNKKTIKDTVKHRTERVIEFFKSLDIKDVDNVKIIIERQVSQNTIAMELMYSVATAAAMIYGNDNTIIFAPDRKFKYIKEEYSTKNLQHKKKSKEMTHYFLRNNYEINYEKYINFDKQDDIADSLNQALVYMVENKLVNEDMLQLRELLLKH